MTAKFGFPSQVKRNTSIPTNNPRSSKSAVLVVDDVILDEDHPYIKETNDITSVGSVVGRIYNGGYDTNTIVAKPAFGNQSHIPVGGECVHLYILPTTNNELNPQYFYGKPVSLYGNDSINYNPLSNSPNIDNEFNLDIKSLKPYKGDIIYEGRFGQGLRFGSTTKSNPWSNDTKKYDPITILSNGIPNSSPFVNEDWKNTQSSVWLTSTQQLNTLGLANENIFSVSSNINPGIIKPSEYKLPQIILNSNRIILNSTQDGMIFSSEKSMNLLSNDDINISTDKNINIDSKNILLGSQSTKQPALLGNDTTIVLNTMIDALIKLISTLSAVPGVNTAASTAITSLTSVKSTLENIKSKDVKLS